MRRTALAAAAALALSALVEITATPAHAAPETGVVLPAGPTAGVPAKVRIAGDLVYATWDGGLYATPADGTGVWTPVTDPVSGEAIQHPLSYWDGLVMTQPADPEHPQCRPLHFATTTHAWSSSPDCFSGIQIGSLGRLVALSVQDPDSHVTTTSVYDAELGPEGGALVTTTDRVALAGSWVWRMHGSKLLGHDTSDANPDRSVATGSPCPDPGLLGISGNPDLGSARAWLSCGPDDHAIALSGSAAPLVLPDTSISLIGDGFVGRSAATSADRPLSVIDFSKKPVAHEYGPGQGFTASDIGLPRLTWVQGSLVHVATLTGLAAPLTAAGDHTAPTIDSVQRPARVVGPSPLIGSALASWSGSDDQAASPTYRLQVSRSGGAPATWTTVPGYEDTLNTSADVGVEPHEKTCLRVRATDRVGNHSPWRLLGCSVRDTEKPTISDTRFSAGPVVLWPTEFMFTYRAVDDGHVDFYDVQRRDARAGGTFGDWHSRRGWRRIMSRHVSLSLGRGHQTCLRVRAHDTARRVSAWSKPRCLTSPYDDGKLHRSGSAHRFRVRGSIDLRVTELSDLRASMSLPSVTGHEVWVLATNVSSCPHVWWGGHQVMRDRCAMAAHTAGAGYGWFTVRTRAPHHGRLVIRSDSKIDRMRVDAVAVLR